MSVREFNYVNKSGQAPRIEVTTHLGHQVNVTFLRGTENIRKEAAGPADVSMITRSAYLTAEQEHEILHHLVNSKTLRLPRGFRHSLDLAYERTRAKRKAA